MTPEEIKIQKALDEYYWHELENAREVYDMAGYVVPVAKTGMGPFKWPLPMPHTNENSLIGYVDRKYKGISPTDKKAIHKKYLSDKGPQCPGCLVYTWEHHHDKACALQAREASSASRTN